jgi:hypothetical protein
VTILIFDVTIKNPRPIVVVVVTNQFYSSGIIDPPGTDEGVGVGFAAVFLASSLWLFTGVVWMEGERGGAYLKCIYDII